MSITAKDRADAPTRGGRTRSATWAGFVLRRVRRLVGVLVLLVIISFLMVRLVPGDPAQNVVGMNSDPAAYDRVRAQMHLDKPWWEQFGLYVGGIARGDLGKSFQGNEPVTSIIATRLGPSVQLVLVAMFFIIVVGFGGGVVIGLLTYDRRGWLANGVTVATGAFGALPHYLHATFLAALFAVGLHWFPVAGNGGLDYAILPALAIALQPTAVLLRTVRVETTKTLDEDYIRTARSKHLGQARMLFRHVVPNVAISSLTLLGVVMAELVSGAVVVETVFARTGLGSTLVNGVLIGDYPVVQGLVVFLGLFVVVTNTVVDVIIGLIDPRSGVLAR